jgi:hypothetical protein
MGVVGVTIQPLLGFQDDFFEKSWGEAKYQTLPLSCFYDNCSGLYGKTRGRPACGKDSNRDGRQFSRGWGKRQEGEKADECVDMFCAPTS